VDGLAAITWKGVEKNLECSVIDRGEGFCLILWRELYICSCYFSPNWGTDVFVAWLDSLNMVLFPYLDQPMLILGDFNARSLIWDNMVNDRGDPLSEAMAGLGFSVLNEGGVSTTFHPRGTSAVDTSWANGRALREVRDWSVVMDAEVFSDHRPILISLDRIGLDRCVRDAGMRMRAARRFPR